MKTPVRGKPVVENDFFDLTQRQAAISQAYRPVLYCGSAENDKTFAVVYNTSGAYIGPTRMKVVVVDAAGDMRRISECHQGVS